MFQSCSLAAAETAKMPITKLWQIILVMANATHNQIVHKNYATKCQNFKFIHFYS